MTYDLVLNLRGLSELVWMIYAMLAVVLLVFLFFIMIVVKRSEARARINSNAGAFDAFEVSGNQLIVLMGIPVIYEIEEIAEITFYTRRLPSNRNIYNGIMQVVKTNGKKSRPLMFDSSIFTKRMVLSSSEQDIEQTIQYLMDKLSQHHIRCTRVLAFGIKDERES